MYNVIIIDDESIILQGLKTIINWEDYNCTVCATAKNAEDGLEKIITNHPDIILTDIKMKNSNGLDMVELALEYVPDAKIIVITGYGTFEYAQRAISLGIFSFLTKPTSPDDIKNIIQKAVCDLNERNLKEQTTEQLQNENALYKSAYIEKKLSDTINFKLSPDAQLDSIMHSNSVGVNSYCLLSIYTKRIANQTDIEKIKEIISNNFDSNVTPYLMHNDSQKNIVVIALISKNDISKYNLSLLFEQINNQLSELLCNNILIKVGSPATNFNYLNKKYQEIMEPPEQSQLKSGGVIFHVNPLCTDIFENDMYHMQEKILEHVLSENTTALREDLDSVFQNIQEHDIDYAHNFIYDILIKLYSTAQKHLYYIHFNESSSSSLKKMIYNSNDTRELLSLLCDIAIDTTNKLAYARDSIVQYTVNKIKQYISQNYADPITRHSIAKLIGVTPNYVSTLFKKATGIPLVGYITQFRIDKAKELLSDKSYKHTEIAEMVGFSSSFYFSKTFKKVTGITPTEYQKNQLDKNNKNHI